MYFDLDKIISRSILHSNVQPAMQEVIRNLYKNDPETPTLDLERHFTDPDKIIWSSG